MTTMTRSVRGMTAALAPRGSWPAPRTWRRFALELVAAVGVVSREMSFLGHLDELRRRLIWALASVAVAFGICCIFAQDLIGIASAPIRSNAAVMLSISRPQDIVALYLTVALVGAIFLSAPFVLAQAWMFISPGLHARERRYAIPFVLSATVLFLLGGAFGYFIAFPVALRFMLDWIVESHLVPVIDAIDYFNLFFATIVALGLVFQIPAVIFVLTRIGLVTARFLVQKFKYAVFGCVVVAAVITPTQDFGNMLIIAGPMVVLYGVGIIVAWIFGRRPRPETP